MTDLSDLENVMRLQAVALELFTLEDSGRGVADRAVAVQQLGEEIEARAKILVARARDLRGLEEELPPAPRRVPAALAPPPIPQEGNVVVDGLNGAIVRDAIRRMGGTVAMAELVAELGYPKHKIKPYLAAMVAGGQVREVGMTRNRVYEYVPPEGVTEARPRRTPPEKLPPAGLERRATGEPVRVRAAVKAGRKGRSTAGQGHAAKVRDRKYDEMEAKKAERAEANRQRAERDMQKLMSARGRK